ncbi:glycosyltransferase family 39 protein [Patescibacteria group bacterium]|nr:glycosyltransferase family 39 protein [Patescibacteria group bacterium]
MKFFKKNWLIFLIVLLAFILRFWGCWYGLPGLFVGDEKSLVGGALKMIYQQNIFPFLEPDIFRLLYYPTLIPWIYLIFFVPYTIFIYLTGNFASVAELRDFFIVNPSMFFLIARIINVFFATGIVWLIYLITKKIFSKRAGLISALLYAVSFLPIHQGHFSKHWNFGAFFGLLVIYFALPILKNPKTKNYVLAGLFTGLAFFTDYIFALYGSIAVLIHILFTKLSLKQRLSDKRLWSLILISLLVSGLAILVYPQEFERIALGEDSTATSAKSLIGFLDVSGQILKTLFYLSTFIFIPSLIGYFFLFFKNKKLFSLLLFIPLISPFLYYFFLHFEPRYVLFFLPILAIVAGFGLDQLIKFLKIESNTIISLIVLIVIFLPLKNAIVFDKMLTQDDTRNLAKEWLENNISAESKIITNSWEFVLIRNQECIYQQQQTDNMSLRSRDYVMMNRAFPNSYCVWPLDLIKVLPKNVDEFEYYLVESFTGRRFAYLGEELVEKGELIKKFKGSRFDPTEQDTTMFVHQKLRERALGPDVEIYKLK